MYCPRWTEEKLVAERKAKERELPSPGASETGEMQLSPIPGTPCMAGVS